MVGSLQGNTRLEALRKQNKRQTGGITGHDA